VVFAKEDTSAEAKVGTANAKAVAATTAVAANSLGVVRRRASVGVPVRSVRMVPFPESDRSCCT
jgi:hypothetical protein